MRMVVTPLWIVYVVAPLGGLSIAIFILDLAMIWCKKLHSKIVYRLAFYQALCALVYSTFMMLGYFADQYFKVYNIVAFTVMAFLTLTKFMFNMWLTLHLYCFAVCYRDLRRLEPLYVSSSLLVPLLASSVYLTINIPIGCHFIESGFIGLLILAGSLLAMTSVVVVAIFVVLLRRHLTRDRHSAVSWYNRTALQEMLPLIAYPVVITFSLIPLAVTAHYIKAEQNHKANSFYYGVFAIELQSFNFFSIGLLAVHIIIVSIMKKCKKKVIMTRNRYYTCNL